MNKITLGYKKIFLTITLFLLHLLSYSQIAQRGTATTATTTTTSLIINKPTGIAVNDIMIANIAQGNNNSTAPTCTGWTLSKGITLGGTNRYGAVLYKKAVVADLSTASYTFTMGAGTNSGAGAIIAFSGVDTNAIFDVAATNISTASSNSVTAATRTTVTPNAAVIMLGQVAGSAPTWSAWSTTSPGSLTELYDVQNSGTNKTSVGAAWALMPTAGPTGTGTATLSSVEYNGGLLVLLRPVATITSLGSSAGCEGGSLVINGTNFTGATNIKIGGIDAASFIVNSSTQITATIGNGLTGLVTVTTPGGVVTSTATFTVTPKPVISGNSFICAGTQQTYSVVSSPGVTYSWGTLPTGWTVVSGTGTNALTVNTTATTGNINMSVTNTATGCIIAANPLAVSSGTPAQPSTISGSTSPCKGNETIYTVTNIPGITYTWTVPTNYTIVRGNGTSAITVLPSSTAATGNISVIASITCGGTTTSSAIRTLSVTAASTPTITSVTNGSVASPGGTLTTAMQATASAGTISWWALPSSIGEAAITTGTSYSPSISQTTTYYVSTTNGGCTSPRQAVIANLTATDITVTGNNVVIPNPDTTPNLNDWTDYGSTQIITAPLIKTFTIKNITTSSMSQIGIQPYITISGNTAFTINSQPSGSIAAGGTSTFSIKFNPLATTTGAVKTTVTLSYNLSGNKTYVFDIQATGIQTFYDSDGDGVFDNVDIDDDNDGIIDVNEELDCKKYSTNKANYKFLNETFGIGNRTSVELATLVNNATSNYCYEDGTISTGNNTTDCPQMDLSDLNDGKYTVAYSAQLETGAPYAIASWAKDYWYKGKDHTQPSDPNGRMALFNANYLAGVFYTATVTGIIPGVPITYSFWALNLDREDAALLNTRLRPNIKIEFQDINGNPLSRRDPTTGLITSLAFYNTGDIAPCSVAGNLSTDWKNFKDDYILVDASNVPVSSFKVIFSNLTIGGIGNDLALDDIQITQTLCDFEGDNVGDLYDLDSDNDGIEDAIEAGLGALTGTTGSIGRLDLNAATDLNGDGLLDSIATNSNVLSTSTTTATLDSDNDKIPNYLDLDSDNDSLFDVDESGAGNSNAVTFQNGDGDITGDGKGDGLDTEAFRQKDSNGDGIIEYFGDGILDIYDYGTGATFSTKYGNSGQGTANLINPAATFLKDTDNDGIPDYLDIKSDGSTFDIATNKLIYDYKTLDSDNNGIIDGTADIDHDGILDAYDTNTATFGSPRDLHTKLYLDFDGRNDYAENNTTILGGLAKASLMAWIDLNSSFNTTGVVLGEKNFQIQITNDKKLQVIFNGSTLTFSTPVTPFASVFLNTNQWYNVGATYDGATLKLFLNGTMVASSAKTGAITTDISALTIGKNPTANDTYFKGKIDEVRVFNIGLTDSQLQRIVYQEIDETKVPLTGTVIPKNIAETTEIAVPFTNMIRYYRMDTYKDDIIDDLTTSTVDLIGTKIYNHKNINIQQAPMPFETITTGSFATAINNTAKDIRGLDVTDNDYSIIKVHHDITEPANSVDLGMIVDTGRTITMNNDNKLENSWYLKLDGKIDLQGMSQLVQKTNSELATSSSGYIERDQQGQVNVFNYNYWSSPVSPIQATANNTNYTIAGVMKDGLNATPRDLLWSSGYNGTAGSASTPTTLSSYWLNIFESKIDDYANWIKISETSSLRVGQGFTAKGSGGTSNFTFVGKPNNGTIANPLNKAGADELFLTGNPYPSALDSNKFITDNAILSTTDNLGTDGTLYFWEHSSDNNSHYLAQYRGGYAVRNLLAGLPPVVASNISGNVGLSAKIPNQNIPVGQGFFVYGNATGGTIVFNNSQRNFAKETDTSSNTLFKINPTNKKDKTLPIIINGSDPLEKNTNKIIRIGFDTYNKYHRQVILGFADEKATSAIDYGYDSYILDDFSSDMFLLNGEDQLVIEGEGYFDPYSSYPIGVKADSEGEVSFMIDGLENFDSNQDIFLYDDADKTYHNIKTENYTTTLAKGENNSRFSLRFTDKSLGVIENKTKDVSIIFAQNTNTLTINNTLADLTVEKVVLFNIIGQSIGVWDVSNQEQQNIKVPMKAISSGVYIAKIKTSKGFMSKKIVLNK